MVDKYELQEIKHLIDKTCQQHETILHRLEDMEKEHAREHQKIMVEVEAAKEIACSTNTAVKKVITYASVAFGFLLFAAEIYSLFGE